MSFSTFLIIGYLVLFLFHTAETIICPSSYNQILNGCYKMNNGSNVTWADARQQCINDSNTLLVNKTGFITHLVAFESAAETTSLIYWMKAWGIHTEFWIDGVASSSSWDWSNQPISWYFSPNEVAIIGNGTNYKFVYDATNDTYKIVDDIGTKLSHLICEYQDPCATNNSCQNNATCYLNVGRELCICASGFTGTTCDQQIDECLSSPCQHGGTCGDVVNNYTCDCSNTFFSGSSCEIASDDPTQSQRSAAFWSVVGIVCSLVALLTLSDLPWGDILTTIGCPWYRFKCCPNDDDDDDDDDIDANNIRLSDSPTNENNVVTKHLTIPGASSRGFNYHVMDTVWNPDQLRNESPSNPQYDGYLSPDQHTTPHNTLIQSFATIVMEKQIQKNIDEKRVYAVDIIEQDNSTLNKKNPADTMVSWTQQLQEQLKNKPPRETSASSTKQLLHSENLDEK